MSELLQGFASEVELDVKTLEALQLRESGAKYRQIADRMHIPLVKAHRLVQRGLEHFHEKIEETSERFRMLELNRLDTMWVDLSVKADGRVIDQSPRVVEAKLKIMERRSKYLGLDAPVQVTGPGGGPIPFQNVDAREAIRDKVLAISVRIRGGASLAEAVDVLVAEGPAAIPATNGNGEVG